MKTKNKSNIALIMTVYLLGIFMGAIDTGIVTPARTVIQNYLDVGEKTGIWMITMYTLAYAASIPVMGKLADKYGRKFIYLISISLFGIGSLFCGLSQNFQSFQVLLAARAIQAIGGGGIVPIANAEFGTSFPKEKRGLALGLVGGVYGIANIFGASAGSAILDIFGTDHWQYIFYINVPITLFIIVAGIISLPNTRAAEVNKIDLAGITIITIMILSVLYGLKNIDFFEFTETIVSRKVYPFLILFVILLPIFCFAEKKAKDPVMNLNYFKVPKIIITLILSFMSGVILMGMIFVPQFSENALKVSSGGGGYFVLILGLFAGIGAPLSGKLIDKYGVKVILGFGFLISALGALFLVFITASYPSFTTVFISLMLVGTGIGFTMGTPLNYMMLDNTRKEEANSALATVSLIRSIGTAIAPAIMVGFISHAGASVQTNVMALLPSEVAIPELPYASELSNTLEALKSDPAMTEKLKGVDIPDFASMQTVQFDMTDSDSGFQLPHELIELMRSSDVTTITEDIKTLSGAMFDIMTPNLITSIQSGIESGITAMSDASSGMEQGIAGMQSAVKAQENLLTSLESMMTTIPAMASQDSNLSSAVPFSLLDLIPEEAKKKIPENVLSELGDNSSKEDMDKKIDDIKVAKQSLTAQIDALNVSKLGIDNTINQMNELKDAIPGAFETAKGTYLSEIDCLKEPIETEFQKTLNKGFKQVYLTVTIASLLSLCILMLYRKKR